MPVIAGLNAAEVSLKTIIFRISESKRPILRPSLSSQFFNFRSWIMELTRDSFVND
jgi:hypothetical protein